MESPMLKEEWEKDWDNDMWIEKHTNIGEFAHLKSNPVYPGLLAAIKKGKDRYVASLRGPIAK